MILRLVVLALAGLGLGLVATLLHAWRHSDPAPLPRAAAIVVLSGPGGHDGRGGIAGETARRVARGVDLHRAGLAPRLVMSGGGTWDGQGWDADRMAEAARAAGIPATDLLTEDRSFSTLQNAWFTARLPGLDPDDTILLVTHRYHLLRSWASFRWAGFRDIRLVAADERPRLTKWVALEAVKWPLNILRATLASTALALGVPEARILPWLR